MQERPMKQDIEAVYRMADSGTSLSDLMRAIGDVLSRHPGELAGMTASYRLEASDTGYTVAFCLAAGQYRLLGDGDETDVTVIGKEQDLLQVFQRKISPLAALLRGKVKLKGSKAALIRLSEFL